MNKALIVIDVQVDFCPGGALAVPNGDKVIPIINKLRKKFDMVAFTKDWHPSDHCSFRNHKGMWPTHCIKNTSGSDFHPNLDVRDNDTIFYKGIYSDAECYSAFQDDLRRTTGLSKFIYLHSLDELYVCGIALDYCVKATVIDITNNNCVPYLITDACAAVNNNPEDGQKAIAVMKISGAKIITSDQI